MKFQRLKNKIQEFIQKHGMSTKAYLFATLAFPPGAFYIIFRHPSWSRVTRVMAFLFTVLVLILIPIATKYTVEGLYYLSQLFV